MPVETKDILDSAEKVGQMVAQHPAAEKYRQAQQALASDPDANANSFADACIGWYIQGG